MKSFSQYIKEEIDLAGNPGVPDDFMRKSDQEAERNLRIRKDDPRQMAQYGPQFGNLISQSSRFLTTNENGGRLTPQQIEERYTALEELAKSVIIEEYGSILDASDKPVELKIRLVRPGRNVSDDLPDITDTPANPEQPDDEGQDEDGQEDDETKETNNNVLTASHKKKILNMITQGEGKATKDIIRISDTVENGLSQIFGRRSTEVLNTWIELSDLADKMDWIIPIRDKANMMSNMPQGMAGACDVTWESLISQEFGIEYLTENTNFTKIVIKAVGVDFPMLLHESIKGIYLLLQSSAIKKDKELAKAIKKATSSFLDEAQDFRYGVTAQMLFNNFINACSNSDKYPKMRARVFTQLAYDKDRGGKYTDIEFLEIMKSIFSVFDKVNLGRDEFVINTDRFNVSVAKNKIEPLISEIVSAEDEYADELNKWEMDQRFGNIPSDDKDKSEEDEFADGDSKEDDIDSLIRKTAQKEQDISNLTPRELQDLIDKALDDKNYDEVRRLSQYIKEGREIYIQEIEINEANTLHTKRK